MNEATARSSGPATPEHATALDESAPVGEELTPCLHRERRVKVVDRRRFAQRRRRLERVEASIGEVPDDTNLLDRHSVDLLDLPYQCRHEVGIGEIDGEFVDGDVRTALEDVDADDVAADGADARRDQTERAGAVGEPHPNEDVRGRVRGRIVERHQVSPSSPSQAPALRRRSAKPPPPHRLALVTAAVESVAGVEASAIEIDRGTPSVTYDTLDALAAPGRDLFLVLGADAVRNMPTWRKLEETRGLATLVIVERAGDAHAEAPAPAWPVERVTIPRLDISSSDLRARLAGGRPVDGLVPAAVVRAIAKRGLYTRE